MVCRNNPFSGTFHTAPGHYSQLHNIARNDNNIWTWKTYESKRKEADNTKPMQQRINPSSSEPMLYSFEPYVWYSESDGVANYGHPDEDMETRNSLSAVIENRQYLDDHYKKRKHVRSVGTPPRKMSSAKSTIHSSLSANELVTFGNSRSKNRVGRSSCINQSYVGSSRLSMPDGEASSETAVSPAIGKGDTLNDDDAEEEQEDVGFQYDSNPNVVNCASDATNASNRQDPTSLFLEGRPEQLSGITIGTGPLAASLARSSAIPDSLDTNRKGEPEYLDSLSSCARSVVTLPLNLQQPELLKDPQQQAFHEGAKVDDSKSSKSSSVLETQKTRSKARAKPTKWVLSSDLLTYGFCLKDLDESPLKSDGTPDLSALQHHCDVGKRLGSGTFATVNEVTMKGNGSHRVVKFVEKRFLFSPEECESIRREVGVLRHLVHPHIVHLYSVFENPRFVMLLMEYVPGGSLKHYIDTGNRGSRRFPEHCVRRLAEQLLESLDYLHNEKHIIHCDIKPENIMLAQTLAAYQSTKNTEACSESSKPESLLPPGIGMYDLVKLVDFGNCRRSKDARYFKQTGDVALVPFETISGTSGYIAPEILQHKSFDTSVDMWSLGIMLYQLLAGFQPYMPVGSRVGEPAFDCSPWNDGHISREAISFIKGLLQADPAQRLKAKKARSHAWFSQD